MGSIDRATIGPARGLTLIELVICTVIIAVLAGAALPVSRHFVRQEKEAMLRAHLRDLRAAIDRYYERQRQQQPASSDHACYPRRLDDLVAARCLRRIPQDPFTLQRTWGTRSSTDPPLLTPASGSALPPPPIPPTNGDNVFDVYSLATATAGDGSPYWSW